MGEAREVMDRLTDAMMGGDPEGVAACYAEDAVAVSPDQGEMRGNRVIADSWREFLDGFPDVRYEGLAKHETANTAIDEGYLVGTHSGALASPTGESIPPTGRSLRLRVCDVATIENGVITSHRVYYDQMEMLSQLGLMEGAPAA